MRFDRAFLMLNLALIFVSVTAHEVAAGTFVYLILNAAVCGLAWHLFRTRSSLRLSEWLATMACIAAFGIMAFRGIASASIQGMQLLDVRVPVVGQFLATFQWVHLFREKKPRDYVWSYLVSAVHMGTAGLLMPGLGYAFFFLSYAMIGLCTLAAYNIWVESKSAGADESEPKLRLGPGFFLAAVPVTLALMLPVAGAFVVLPRRAEAIRLTRHLVKLSVQPVSGFSDTVVLGEIGEIQMNPNRVMHVKVLDPESGKSVRVPELLLRGIALDHYVPTRGRWAWKATAEPGDLIGFRYRHSSLDPMYQGTFPGFEREGYRRIQCEITLEPLQRRFLFVPFAPETVTLPGGLRLVGHRWNHDLWYNPRMRTQLHYTVTARLFEPRRSSGMPPAVAPNKARLATYLTLHPDLSPRIKELVDTIAPDAECPDDYAKAIRIRDYLSDSSRFAYTLVQTPTPGVEPVEDFLFNLRQGHCEYFASAMVVMLRAAGVPARLVNGFKVSEWNPIGGYYLVRQAHAHSWVEAYLRPDGWRTLDPSVMRDAATPRPIFARRWYRHLYDTAETFWVQRVLNYDSERQEEIFSRARAFAKKARNGLKSLWARAKNLPDILARLIPFDWPAWGIAKWSRIGAVVLLLVFLAVGLPRLVRRPRGSPRRSGAALRIYDSMERLLRRRGFRRPAWQTPWEFHDALAAQGCPSQDALALITRSFCLARYGGRLPTQEEVERLREALETIRTAARRMKADGSGQPN